ncbi:hypothetical protein [Glutamicibacter arilaitensis]|uniref:hypothetical protein n=1 Tax=Glutamicibacter arilaitensis TaxID=256701 RepID=UPI00384AA4D3
MGDPDELILPVGFPVEIPKDSGRADVELAPTGNGWVWEVYSHGFGVSPEYAYVAVPEPLPDPNAPGEFLPVDYPDLVHVDRATLDPVAAPDPLWWAELEAGKALAGDVEAARVDAEGSATSAAQSADDSFASASGSAGSALSASESALLAGESAGLANTSAVSAGSAKDAAEVARDATVAAAGGSELSAQSAADAATASAQSAADAVAAAEDVVTRANNGEFDGQDGDPGAPGNPTAFELRGVGSPLGVVTAPPGTYYTDTAGTAGAWRWLKKSGTGNTGWEVIEGDTGVRRYRTEDMLNGWAGYGAPSFSFKVQRVRNKVTIGGYFNASGAISPTALQLPIGFRPRNSGDAFPLCDTLGIPQRLFSISAGNLVHNGQIFAANCLIVPVTFTTGDPWPTTFPGIPN